MPGIHNSSKVIIGVEHSGETGWFLLHLHDCLSAVSIRPKQEMIVIAQGQGRGRLQDTRIPFENVVRFEAFEVPVGHSCVSAPVDPEAVGEHSSVGRNGLFIPVGVRLLIRGLKHEFFSVIDLGVTALPILVPLLKELPAAAFGLSDIKELRSADDCLALSKRTYEWVLRLNETIREARERREDELTRICRRLDLSKPADRQVLVSAHEALRLRSSLAAGAIVLSAIAARALIRKLRLKHSFPLPTGLRVSEGDSPAMQITVDKLRDEVRKYHDETGRPVSEALEVVSDHINDLQQMSLNLEELNALLKELGSKRVSIIDPADKITEKNWLLTDKGIWHEQRLEKVCQDEELDVCYLEGLLFLSLLVEYESEGGEKRYFVAIKKGLPLPLSQFLLAHELGHYHLHVKSKLAEKFKQVDSYLRSSGEPNFLEEQADQFAMALLFPPAYLADQENLVGELSAKSLYEDFLKDVEDRERVSPRLKKAMLEHINRHITRYHEFKNSRKPSFLSIAMPFIEVDDIGALRNILCDTNRDKYWVRLDENSEIVERSDSFVELVGQSPETAPADLVDPEEKDLMRLRAEVRKNKKKPIYYFTKLWNGRHVIVYSFPILKGDDYVGAMGILTPIDEIEHESMLTQAPQPEVEDTSGPLHAYGAGPTDRAESPG